MMHPLPPNCSTKKAMKPSNSPKMYSRYHKSERGRHLQKRRRSPSPPSSSYDSKELDAFMESSTKLHVRRKLKGHIVHGNVQRSWKRLREEDRI